MSRPNPKFNIRTRVRAAATALAIAFALCLVAAPAAPAQAFTVLHQFTGGSDGAYPSQITMDRAGKLYGTTFYGASQNCTSGCGGVYKLTDRGSGWTFSPLYDFQGPPDGQNPGGTVTFGPDGAAFGVTEVGGDIGYGAIYKLTPPPTACKTAICGWTETLIYQFAGKSDGGFPWGAVIFDAAGNLYGVAAGEGGGNCYEGCGNVYKLTPSNGGWTQTVVYQFQGPPNDGASPSSVIFDKAGNIYGTTASGGLYDFGTVFELTPSGAGWTEKILHNFQDSGDGTTPVGSLVFDSSGNLYGTTSDSFYNTGGTVFELSPSGGWTFQTIYSFSGTGGPRANVTLDAAANLYGTTYGDGAYGYGAVFKLTPASGGWTYTSLYDFKGEHDGQNPASNVLFDAAGNLYGTTYRGGQNYQGMVFEITP